MMTKKHYEGIAAALRRADASTAVIEAVAKFCALDNPAFKAARFKEAARWHDTPTVKARELARLILATWIGDRNLCDDVEDIAQDFDFGDVPSERREMVKESAADILRDFSNEEAA